MNGHSMEEMMCCAHHGSMMFSLRMAPTLYADERWCQVYSPPGDQHGICSSMVQVNSCVAPTVCWQRHLIHHPSIAIFETGYVAVYTHHLQTHRRCAWCRCMGSLGAVCGAVRTRTARQPHSHTHTHTMLCICKLVPAAHELAIADTYDGPPWPDASWES